jgi:FkbM family methyltransferase
MPVRIRARRMLEGARRANRDAELDMIDLLVGPDEWAIDVGAHVGLYAAAMLESAQHVVAFEPDPWAALALKQLFADRLNLLEAAASDVPGAAVIHVPRIRDDLAHARATLEPAVARGLQNEEVAVLRVRIDDLALDRVGLIKVDVEGHEQSVLRGAEATLRRCQPALIVESEIRHRADGPTLVERYLGDLGYAGMFAYGEDLLPFEAFRPDVHQRDELRAAIEAGEDHAGDYANNFIFLPTHKADLRAALERRLSAIHRVPGPRSARVRPG